MLGASALGFRSPGEEFSKLGSGIRARCSVLRWA